MKKVLLIAFMFLIFGVAQADRLTLTTPQTTAPPEATSIEVAKYIFDIENRTNQLIVIFYYLDIDGNRIYGLNEKVEQKFRCQNMADNPATVEDETSTCWSDIIGYSIRAQDEGVKIGIGLRTLIWNKMKNDPTIVTPGNDGTFAND